MKKNLIAAAVVSAFAAPVFAQPANVTIYGNLEQQFMSVSGSGGAAPQTDYQRRNRVGSPGTNWIGFRGSESLGGGLSAVWQVESSLGGIDGSSASAGWATRNTFVGLSGGFGTIHAGLFDSPLKRVLGINNVATMRFGLTGPNGMNSILNNGDASGTDTVNPFSFSRRTGNSVNYISPSFNGFQVAAQYGANENKSATSGTAPQVNPYLFGVSATYTSGPFRVGLGYQKHNDFRVMGGSAQDDDSWLLSASWTSGPFLVQGAYSRLNYGTNTGDLKRDNWLIGGAYSMAQHRFRLQYQLAGDTKGATGTNAGTSIGNVRVATAPNGLGSDTGASMWSIGYGYVLSKRTEVYGFASRLNNDRNGIVNHSGGHASVPGLTADTRVNIYGLGIVHSF